MRSRSSITGRPGRADLEQLLNAVRELVAGGSVVDPKVVEAPIAARTRAEESPLDSLTVREHEVLQEMAAPAATRASASSSG